MDISLFVQALSLGPLIAVTPHSASASLLDKNPTSVFVDRALTAGRSDLSSGRGGASSSHSQTANTTFSESAVLVGTLRA